MAKSKSSGTNVTPGNMLGGSSSKGVTTMSPIVSVGQVSPGGVVKASPSSGSGGKAKKTGSGKR